jgi:predicted metal-dependent enzyme (double-stranded beta helix superfamily)
MIQGQGVFVFRAPRVLTFSTLDESDGLHVDCTSNAVIVIRVSTSEAYKDPANSGGATWFSLDSHNQQLCAGLGEPRIETATYRFKLPRSERDFLEELCLKNRYEKYIKDPISIRPVPLTLKPHLSMHDVARGVHMHRSHLSPVARQLYDCVAAKEFVLPKGLAQAIDRSIATPGLWCHEKLKEKDPALSYLRITLGLNGGESPGVPYVMEIWPVGHHSPIHNHAGSHAIIKVLRGAIHVSLFPCLEITRPFTTVELRKGDVTWISPELNATHQLENLGSKTCITIQCYMYGNGDTTHYDYFDYLDQGVVHHFDPDSDMDFCDFVDLMKKEVPRKHWFS